jgi:hypothetical protein
MNLYEFLLKLSQNQWIGIIILTCIISWSFVNIVESIVQIFKTKKYDKKNDKK